MLDLARCPKIAGFEGSPADLGAIEDLILRLGAAAALAHQLGALRSLRKLHIDSDYTLTNSAETLATVLAGVAGGAPARLECLALGWGDLHLVRKDRLLQAQAEELAQGTRPVKVSGAWFREHIRVV